MQDRGGINFLAEYDGSGLNLGASVPLVMHGPLICP